MSRLYGYAGKILRINLSNRDVKVMDTPKEVVAKYVGGRGFNARTLYSEVGPNVHPLSPGNKFMIASGPVAGTAFPIGARLNVSAKSPQTGLLGDSNVGGHFAAEMKYAGYDQIIIEGKSDKAIYIYVSDDGVEFRDAEGLKGLTVAKAYNEIRRELRDWRAQVALIGPAAEKLVKFSGVFFNVYRPAARTGLGAVLASKNVKAVVVRGEGCIEVANPKKFEEFVEGLEDSIYSHQQYWPRRVMGTSRILLTANKLGFLPVNHFQSSVAQYSYRVSGERLALEYNVKNRSCFSCVVPCSRFYVVKYGDYAGCFGEGPEYEALAAMTVRIGNDDLDAALKLVSLTNDLGMDVISVSEVISWCMELFERGMLSKEEVGLSLEWGDVKSVMRLVEMIAYREGFGNVLAEGVAQAAEIIGRGKELAFHVKGLEMIQADPRGLKGYGLGFAVASRGADHLRSEPFIELLDDPKVGAEVFGEPEATLRLGVRGKGKLVAYYENWCALVDSLEVCKNVAENMEVLPPGRIAELIKVVTGLELTEAEVIKVGERIVNLERAYLVREGVRRRDDRLPKRFLEEPIKEGPSKGHTIELDTMLDEYYTARGWDLTEGIPTAEKLTELELVDVVDDLRRAGVTLPLGRGGEEIQSIMPKVSERIKFYVGG